MTLVQRWNYHNELGAQFPIAPVRVVYAKAGTLPAACIARDKKSIAENLLYWCPVATEIEGEYLARSSIAKQLESALCYTKHAASGEPATSTT